MKVRFVEQEWYPVWAIADEDDVNAVETEVDEATMARWREAFGDFETLQYEICKVLFPEEGSVPRAV